MSVFEHVRLVPADPILGLTEAFKADERTSKVNLGIGVYLDENGQLPLMECVHAAEDRLARRVVDECLPLAETHGPLWHAGTYGGMGTARLVAQALPALERIDGVVVEMAGEVPDYREAEEAPLITTDVADDAEQLDWFSLRVSVRVGDEDVPIDRLMTAVATGPGRSYSIPAGG